MTSSWDSIVTASGQVLTAAIVNQIVENISAATEQQSGAPYQRLPYLNTTSLAALTLTGSAGAVAFDPNENRYKGYDGKKDTWDYLSKTPVLTTGSRDALTLNGSDGLVNFNPSLQQYEGYNPVTGQWGTIGGGSSIITVVYSDHTFTNSEDLGFPKIWDTSSWMNSDASTPDLSDVLVLANVIDSNQIELQQSGKLTLSNSRWWDVISGGPVQGAYYWLGASGQPTYVNCAPTTDGWVDKPVLWCITSEDMLVLNFRGAVIGGGNTKGTFFTSSNFTIENSEYLFRFAHGFDTLYPNVDVFDAAEQPVHGINYYPASGFELSKTEINVSSSIMEQMSLDTWYAKFSGAADTDNANISSADPEPIGTAAAGTSGEYSDAEHVHGIKEDTPASAAATGTKGEIVIDADYIYYCTATDTWKRVALSTWP